MEGSTGVRGEQRGCSGLSSEAGKLLHVEALHWECVHAPLCVCVRVCVHMRR